jgi:enamine deaminase RidA (YjgF/YER057c/UK114 family)
MRIRVFEWLDREFVAVSGEARPGANASDEARQLFTTVAGELKGLELSLDNTVRSRIWGRDRESRDLGSAERVKALAGRARSASSSFIAADYFDSDARVAVELLAMRPSRAELEKTRVEYDPPIVPVRYIVYDSVVFLSGVTAVLPTLEEQIADIVPRISESLEDAGTSWDRVARVSCVLHRSQTVASLRAIWPKIAHAPNARIDFAFADGYSSPGKLVEVEVTARG